MMSEQAKWLDGIDANTSDYDIGYAEGRKKAFLDVLDLVKDEEVYDEIFVGWLRRKVEALQKGEE